MKKLHVLFLFILMAAVTVVSCDDEPLEGVFSVTGDGSDPSEPDPDSETCQLAFDTLVAAQAAFSSATEANYSQVCGAYATAIQATIQLCGDASGTLQATLTSLGDCSTPDPCFQAETAANAALGAFNNATSDNEEQLCLAYSNALAAQIVACGDSNGNIQATIDALNCGGDCAAAQVASLEAQEIFNAVDPLDEDAYTAACADYSMALQAQIAACGDTDGSLTAIVQDLGDCSPPEQDGPVQVTVGDVFTNFNTATVSISGSLLSVVATDIDTGDTFTFDIVLQQTGDNVMQNTILTVGGVVHTPSIEATTPFVNNITANDGTTIVGTFSGTFTNPDNEEVLTADGMINIIY
ncbi:hypothetical protein [Dokdonia sp. Asnod1-B02]|uniref:hypothetical protein n=1 Tax=Dokdonia sp. Asnod1-B02 TaxID=3160573 RepID=UPI00386A1929